MNLKMFFAGILSLSLAACASGPTIDTKPNPETDFSTFKTYNFVQPLGTDNAEGERTKLSSRLVSSMNRKLISRGLSLSDEPDLRADFMLSTEAEQDSEGTLVIKLIDPATNAVLGEGTARSNTDNKAFTQMQLDEIVNRVIDELMVP
ncbi:DUF4136 domain-containing protein [Pseudomonadota bacterium]